MINRKIRVLFVIPTLDVGGAEMDLVHNVPRLDPDRFETVVCTMLRRGALEAPLRDAGVPIIGPFTNQNRLGNTPKRAWLASALRSCLRPLAQLRTPL